MESCRVGAIITGKVEGKLQSGSQNHRQRRGKAAEWEPESQAK